MKNRLLKMGGTGLLCVALLASGMSIGFAATTDSVSSATTQETGHKQMGGGPNFDSLVTDGTITSAQKEAIETAMKAGRESKKKMDETLAELVTAGTITQTQSDAILKAITPSGNGGQGGAEGGKSPLVALVTAGTITQAQSDAIEAAMKPDSSSTTRVSPSDALTALVTAGTITEAQKTAVESAMKRPDNNGQQGQANGSTQNSAPTETKAAPTATKTAASGISVKINGQAVAGTVAPYVDKNSRTMIELRSVAEALGATLEWDSATKTVTLTANGNVVKIQIDNSKYSVNGEGKAMDTAAVIKDGRTMVPVRVVSEALGSQVSYDAQTKTVSITQ